MELRQDVFLGVFFFLVSRSPAAQAPLHLQASAWSPGGDFPAAHLVEGSGLAFFLVSSLSSWILLVFQTSLSHLRVFVLLVIVLDL